MKLDQLDAAISLDDLAALPDNRFEALKGDRTGQNSIRINDQWRVCFEWPKKGQGPEQRRACGLPLRSLWDARRFILANTWQSSCRSSA